MTTLQLLLFIVGWAVTLYGFNCIFARRIKRIKATSAALYIAAMAMLGVFGEVIIDSIYFAVNGRPLWEYQILPIHHAFTSQYSLAIWGIIGFHLYLMHDTLQHRGIHTLGKLSLIFCLEAVVLEALGNLSFLALFGRYLYYYLPPDLGHITSLQVVPLYLVAGLISVFCVQKLHLKPRLYAAPCAMLALSFVYLIKF